MYIYAIKKNIKTAYLIIGVIIIISTIIILSSLQYNIFEGFDKDIYTGVKNIELEHGKYPMKDCRKLHDNYLNNGDKYIDNEKKIDQLKKNQNEKNKNSYNIQIQTHQTNNREIANDMNKIVNSETARKYNCFNRSNFY